MYNYDFISFDKNRYERFSFFDQDFDVVMDGTALLEEELALCLFADAPPLGVLGGIVAVLWFIGTPRVGNTKPG